jgi:hypothetical protein
MGTSHVPGARIGGVLVTAVETSERLKVEKALEFKTQELFEAIRKVDPE